ncbi:MAG: hypothetical protein ACRDAW_01395, partial [Metamycoplasmataceae bacterium]
TLSKEQEVLLMSPTTPQNTLAQMNVLKKLFPNVTNTNFNYFTFKVEARVVTLTAKQGFVFGNTVDAGKPSLVAPAYTISTPPPNPNINLGITDITPTGDITTEDINNLTGIDPAKQLISLSKLFKGIDDTKQNNFTFVINESTRTITLTAKGNYTFGAELNAPKKLDSQVFTEQFTPYDIVAHTGNLNLTADEITIIKENKDPAAQLKVLTKLFFGILNQNYLANLTITIDENAQTVTVKPNYGYTLQSGKPTETASYTKA